MIPTWEDAFSLAIVEQDVSTMIYEIRTLIYIYK